MEFKLWQDQKHRTTGVLFVPNFGIRLFCIFGIYQRIGKKSLRNLNNGFLVSLEDTPSEIKKEL